MPLFSTRKRPPHLVSYPSEGLARRPTLFDLNAVPPLRRLDVNRPEQPHSIVNAMREHQAMLDAIRDGLTNRAIADAPTDPVQRSGHLKSFARFCDATEAATCALPEEARRKESIVNPDVQQLAEELKTRQIRTQAAGIDMIMAYEFESLDGSDLPAWEAGAHLDIVVAPQFPRQYSMCGDPADRRPWRIGVLRELEGRGGSALLHRIFNPGRTLFVSKPINHFLVVATAQRSKLMASGFGIPPIMAMAHELHRARRDFELHCSDRNRSDMAI